MKRRLFIYAFMISCAFPAPIAQAEGEVLTLEKVMRHVYEENPTIEASRYGLKATHELYPQALAGWHPTINAEAGITSTDIETSGFSTANGATTKSVSITAEQLLFRGGRTYYETESAKSQIKAGYKRMLQTEQDIFLRTVETYMNVIRDRMLLEFQRSNREALSAQEDSLKARFEAGDVTSTDVKRAEARLAEADALSVRAEGDLRASEALFEEVVGYLPTTNMIVPTIDFSIPDTIAKMIEIAEKNNPNLFISKFEQMAAESDIGTASSDRYPQVAAFASHIKEYDPQPGVLDESETSTLGVRMRVNLYEGGKTVSRIREAKNRANQRYIQALEAERKVRSALVENWSKLQAYRAEIASRELAVLAANLSREGVTEEARLGERTTIETLDAERDMLESQVALANAKRDMVVTAYELAAALGLLLPEHMGMADLAYDPGPHYRGVSHRIFSTKED